MRISGVRQKDTPPVLEFFLLGAGLACGAAAFWLARVDLVGFVGRQITRAHGTISAETSAWLRSSDVPGAFLCASLVLLGLGVLAHLLRPAMRQSIAKFAPVDPAAAPRRSAPRTVGIALVACLTVFVHFFPSLRSGYFRYDDFEILSVAKDGSFWATLWQLHGDHFLPLTRVLAFLAFKLWGVTAWPYNLWELLCLCGVLIAGILMLEEMEIGWPAQLIFVSMLVFWSPLAEMMSGYYILSIYLLIAMLGLAAIRFYLRWLHTGKAANAVWLVVCLFLAPLVDVSGYYVIGACGVFLGADLEHFRFS